VRVGEVAGALHGWPLILSDEGTLDLVVHPEDRALAAETVLAALAAPDRIRLLDAPPGTYGFADLARAAIEITVGNSAVEVAGLVDLLRIALTDPAPYSQRFALAFDATLQLTARGPSPMENRPDRRAHWLTGRDAMAVEPPASPPRYPFTGSDRA
jgi:hypothetical protein